MNPGFSGRLLIQQKLSIGVFLVSHDRRFSNYLVNKRFELKDRNITIYEANCSGYKQLKKVVEEVDLRSFIVPQKYIKNVASRVGEIRKSLSC